MLTDIAHQRAVQILHGGEDGLRAHITLNAREPVLDPIEPGRGKRPANPCWRLSCAGNPAVPIDNNHVERQIRPVALGRSNWLFAGSLRAGQRAAAVMSLIQSAKLNGHDPYAYLKDVLTRLPTHKAADIGELLPHRWVPSAA